MLPPAYHNSLSNSNSCAQLHQSSIVGNQNACGGGEEKASQTFCLTHLVSILSRKGTDPEASFQ